MDTVEVYRDDVGEWRWRRNASNHEIIAQGEGYTRKSDAVRGTLRANRDASKTTIEIVTDSD